MITIDNQDYIYFGRSREEILVDFHFNHCSQSDSSWDWDWDGVSRADVYQAAVGAVKELIHSNGKDYHCVCLAEVAETLQRGTTDAIKNSGRDVMASGGIRESIVCLVLGDDVYESRQETGDFRCSCLAIAPALINLCESLLLRIFSQYLIHYKRVLSLLTFFARPSQSMLRRAPVSGMQSCSEQVGGDPFALVSCIDQPG